jgi:hypothetical protein
MQNEELLSFHRGQEADQKNHFLFPKIPRPTTNQIAPYSPLWAVVKTDLCIGVSQKVSRTG